MKIKTRFFSFFLVLLIFAAAVPLTELSVFAENEQPKEDAMTGIEEDETLNLFKQGEKQSISDDGYIGIPVEITVYFDSVSGSAKPGYNGTPVILYVVNAGFERVGTESDVKIIKSMLERGYAVAVLDYLNDPRAESPALDYSTQLLRAELIEGAFFRDIAAFPSGSYYESLIVPAGCDVLYNEVYFELDKHGTDGTLEKIVNVWNNDFRKYKQDTVVKWVYGDGTRKPTQNGFDGSSPVWYSDAEGKIADSANGQYIKINYTKAEEITDCVKKDGSPIDLNLYIHVIYPVNPADEVPVMALMSSAGHLISGATNTERPQLNGFLFNGYAGVIFDYPFVPMCRNDHYGYFDGSSGDGKSVTGDNQSYAVYTYNAAQTATAAMRYIRYLSLSEHTTYKFNNERIGIFGISKAAWMTFLGSPVLREELITRESGMSDAEVAEAVNRKINSFYQNLYLPGHSGESRYDNGKTESYTKNGATIDGGELQPWASYNGAEISSGAEFIYSSCGAAVDYIGPGYSPMFITVNLQDNYNTGYNMQNILVNLCRVHDVPALWFEADIAHTFANGTDHIYGVDTYDAFMRFADYYLKDAPVSVAYVSPSDKSMDVSVGSPITVKFMGEVSASEIEKVTVSDTDGNILKGKWSSSYGNTEWTFSPSAMSGGKTYTLTIPAELKGTNGKEAGRAYSFSFTTVPEITAGFDIAGGRVTVSNTKSSHFSFTVPALTEPFNQLKLRVRIDNDAANIVRFYCAEDESDFSGELLGELRTDGAGYYEYDVTDYVMSKKTGQTVYFLVKSANAANESTVYEEDFSFGTGDFTTNGYAEYENTEIDGSQALKVVLGMNTGKYGGDHVYYTNTTVLTNKKIIDGGDVLTKADNGRKFIFTLRVYDTVSRPIRLYLNGITNQAQLALDYDRVYYTLQTEANKWTEFRIPYTVYESDYGKIGEQAKIFYISVNPSGNTEMPIYFDDFKVSEIFTDIEISEAALVSAAEGNKPYRLPVSESPFDVNGELFDDWRSALSAAGDGDTVKLMSSYELTDDDLVSIADKSSVTIDLNGYKLICGNTENAPLWLTASNADKAAVILKNGTIMLSDTPLISYAGSSPGGNGKEFDIHLENLYIGLTPGANLKNIISESSAANGVSIRSNITFEDTVIDIKRENLADNPVTALTEGSGALSVKYTFIGGEIRLSSVHELALIQGAVTLSADSYGGYLTLIVPQSLDQIPDISLIKDGKYAFFSLERAENGYAVYTAEEAGYQTKYGAVPDKYAYDTDNYPFVVFMDGAFVSAEKTWQAASNKVIEKIGTAYGAGKTVTVLLRSDYTNNMASPQLGEVGGTFVVDLGGHTLTRGTSVLFEAKGMHTYSTDVVVRNGVINASGGPVIHLNHDDELKNKDYTSPQNFSFTFEDIYFSTPENVNPGNLICVSYYDGGSVGCKVNMLFEGCTFDLTNAHSDRWITVFNLKDNGGVSLIDGSVTVVGGELLVNTMSKVTLLNGNPEDTVIYRKDGNGSYIRLSAPSGYSLPKLYLNTPEGALSFGNAVVSGDRTVYTLEKDSLATQYGIISEQYADANAYPFAVFMDGSFVSAEKTWQAASNKAAEKLGGEDEGKTVTVLLRSDFENNANPPQLSDMSGTLVLDLGGYSLTRGSRCIFEAKALKNHTVNVIVKNGTLIAKGGAIININHAKDTESPDYLNDSPVFDFTFSGVTFEVSDGATASSLVCVSYCDGGVRGGKTNITLNDCDFDFTAAAPSSAITVFNMRDNNNAIHNDITTVVNGGRILADSLEKITLYRIDSDDKITFGKGENGDYITLTCPSEYRIPKIAVNTANGAFTFGNGAAGEENTVYTLVRDPLVTEYGIIPEDFADADLYPFAVFMDGEFIACTASWGDATAEAYDKLTDSRNAGKKVQVLMRADSVNTVQGKYLCYMNGSLLLDLGGHTLTRTKCSLFEGATRQDYNGSFRTYFTVKNGVLLAGDGQIMAFESKYETGKEINITFENVTFALAKGSSAGYLVSRCWGSSGPGIVKPTITFNDCIFDLSGMTEGASAPAGALTVIDISQNIVEAAVQINGGKILGSLDGITLIKSDTKDLVTFGKGKDGYTELITASADAPEIPFPTDYGDMYFTEYKNVSDGGAESVIYRLGIGTEYGVISPDFADENIYPFAVFMNGECIGAGKNWGEASALAAEILSGANGVGKTAQVLLRGDHVNTSNAAQLSQITGTLLLDLGGHTMIRVKTIFEADARHNHVTRIYVKNGTLLAKDGAVMQINRTTTDGYTENKSFYFTFENVTFGLAEGADTKNLVCITYCAPRKSAQETCDISVIFNSCTFDLLSNAPSTPVTLINFKDGDATYIDGSAVICGGKIIASSLENISIYDGSDGDSIVYTHNNGEYITVTLPNTADGPTGIYTTPEGNALFKESSNDGINTVYTLSVCSHIYSGDCDSFCDECGAERKVSAAHAYDQACDPDCNVCGAVREITHNYSVIAYNDTEHWRECGCGAKSEEAEHSGGTATCTKKAVCSVCGSEYGELGPHTYSDEWQSDADRHWRECACGAKSEESEHSGGTSTCTEKAVCSVCGSEYDR